MVSVRASFDVGYSRCNDSCRAGVRNVTFCKVSVASNENAVVIVLTESVV